MNSFRFVLVSLALVLAVCDGKKKHRSEKLGESNQADTSDVPFIVSIKNVPFDYHKCAGFLVSDRHVVTTAACLFPVAKGAAQVYLHPRTLGDLNDRYEIQDWVIHRNFSIVPRENDVAVITLKVPVTGIEKENIPDIIKWSALAKGTEVYTYGWGYSKIGNKRYGNFALQSKKLRIMSNAMCSLLTHEYLQCDTVCASSDSLFTSSSADVGVPLIYRHDSKDYAVGILTKATEKLAPIATYLSLFEYRDFIDEIVREKEPEQEVTTTPEPEILQKTSPNPVPEKDLMVEEREEGTNLTTTEYVSENDYEMVESSEEIDDYTGIDSADSGESDMINVNITPTAVP